MSIVTYPLDGKYYNAQDAETYLCTRTSGVFSEDISFTPNGMNITVSPFLAWIKNDDFSGKSVAVTTDTTLTISPSEPILSRIDRIVLRFDASKNGSELMVLKGTPSSSPAVPSISRTPVIYDLCLCQVSVKPSATSISAGDITSTLLDESLCGIMRDGVTGIPTLQLQSQAQALLRELEAAISMAENGSPVLQSLGIKRGVVYVTIGKKGQKIYSSDDVELDTMFYDEPKVIVTRKGHTFDETVFKYIKPQESLRVSGNKFNLDVFSEKDIPTTYTLKYNWIAIGKVKWENGDTGGGEEEPEVEYFNIRTTVSPEGTGTTTGAGKYAKGSTVTLNATPASGYAFEGWYIGSSKITSNASYNITVTSDTIYTAKFVEEVPMITVTVTTDPVGAGSVSGAGTYPKGSTVRLTASPGDRYRFIGWYSGDTLYSSETEYSVTLNSSMAFVAKFEEEVVTPDYYTIITKVSPTGAGYTTGGGQYTAGTSVKLTAAANEGYLFSHWSRGTETRGTAEITVEATTDQTWTANFIEGEEDTKEKVTITINVEPEGAGTVAGNGEVNLGVMTAIQATANPGYKFKHWRLEDGTTNEANPKLFKASADRTFVAVFEVDSEEEETTHTKDTWVGTVLYVGTEETKIETENAYSLDLGLTEVIIPEGRTRIAQLVFSDCSKLAKVTMPSTMTFIGMNAFDGCSSLTEIAYNGTKSQWNAIDIRGVFQNLDDLTVHCSDGNIEYCEVDFVFSPLEGIKTFNPHTQIDTTLGTRCYVKNSTVTLKSTPKDGYSFVRYERSDGVSSTSNPYSFTITQSMTVTVVTERENYAVTTKVSPEGAGSTTGDGSYTNGSSATLSATANEGYIFSHWEYDVGGTSKLNPVTFPVEQNVVATAVFLDITNGVTYKISSSNAESGDTINLYPYDVASNTLDYSNPLGTTKVLYAGDDTHVYYYAKAGQNRTISSVKLSVGASSETISGEDLNDYFVDGALNIPGGFYDPSEEGTIKELVVYFAET